MKVVSVTGGIGLVFLSLVACVVFLIAIVDPVGTKMADDSDPFGQPPSRLYSASGFFVSVLIGVVGIYLTGKPFQAGRDAAI